MKRRLFAAAFTLPEVLISAGIGAVIMAGLVTGAIALQKGYAAADYSVRCQLDQMRVIDYITRDLRRATSVTSENSGRKLVLALPDQQAAGANSLRIPVVSDGVVRYGGSPISVAYYIEGDLFIREVAGARTTIADKRLENFLVSLDTPQTVTFQLAFTPTFSPRSGYGRAASTIVTSVPLPRPADVF